MDKEKIITQLEKIPLFSRLKRPHLRTLTKIVHLAEFGKGQTIYHQGEPGDRYYIVVQGLLRVTRIDAEGRVTEVRTLGPGEAFGETSLFLGDVRDATVEVIKPAALLLIVKTEFERLLEQEPEIRPRLKIRSDIARRLRYPRFPWMEEAEVPVLVMHKHISVLIPPLVIPTVFVILLMIGGYLLAREFGPLAVIPVALVTLIPLGIAFYVHNDWQNDVYVITNRRVVHLERVGFTKERFSAAPLYAIQDVQEIHEGFLHHVFDVGELIVETAGGAGQVVFLSIPNPSHARSAIFEQIERSKALLRAQERAEVAKLLRRHFLGEEEAAAKPSPPEQHQPKKGLTVLAAALRNFFPPLWHQEGKTVTWRKHWVALFRIAGIPILIFTLLTIVVLVIVHLLPQVLTTVTLLYAFASFLIVPWLLWKFDDWQNDFYQVTATRVIHVDRLPFYLRESRREANLEQVTNVRFEQSFWGKIFKYGDVFVETAAPAGAFHFQMVTQPQKVQAEVFAHIEEARRLRQEREARQHRAELLDWFSAYDELRRGRPPEQMEE